MVRSHIPLLPREVAPERSPESGRGGMPSRAADSRSRRSRVDTTVPGCGLRGQSRQSRALPPVLSAVLLAALAAEARPAAGDRLAGALNLNEATEEELCLLPGIGPAKAERILEFRRERRFSRIEDIVLVRGIGPLTYRRLAVYLRVRGPTTLRRIPEGEVENPRP